jgi:short subunit dehydrogenase-like uncharacterized protein
MAREFDLVLLGATGFTGRLVAQYLALAAPPGTRIALAGRDQARLEGVRRSLPAAAQAWPVLLADSTSQPDMTTLAPRTTVVCTTVGPYAKFGLPLVAACAQAGTHTCDLSGEVQFMRDCIDRFDAAARLSGARIVHSCGFDSIPSDLGVHLLHERLGPMTRATLVIEELKGGFSGGTFASLFNGLEEALANPQRRKLLGDPYALSPDRPNEPVLENEGDLASFRHDPFVGRWVAPFVMASVNTRVVRRSNALRGWQYGRRFRYAEVSGMKGPLTAAGLTLGLGAFMGLLAVPFTRKLVAARLPQPGEGPSPAQREHGRLRLRILGEAESGQRAAVVVSGRGDPGYALTSVMLGEAALCLAFDAQALPARAGVLTPATAMGSVLVERLRAAGLSFEVEGSP